MNNSEIDLRSSPRVRSFLRGEIVHSGGASRTQCTVRDLSEAGARIQISSSVTLPEFFELLIPVKGRSEQAKIAWMAGDEIGVVFIKAELSEAKSQNKPGNDLENRIKIIENDIVNLRLELIEMKNYLINQNNTTK